MTIEATTLSQKIADRIGMLRSEIAQEMGRLIEAGQGESDEAEEAAGLWKILSDTEDRIEEYAGL